jgi:hypothetical protein
MSFPSSLSLSLSLDLSFFVGAPTSLEAGGWGHRKGEREREQELVEESQSFVFLFPKKGKKNVFLRERKRERSKKVLYYTRRKNNLKLPLSFLVLSVMFLSLSLVFTQINNGKKGNTASDAAVAVARAYIVVFHGGGDGGGSF